MAAGTSGNYCQRREDGTQDNEEGKVHLESNSLAVFRCGLPERVAFVYVVDQ